METTTTPKKTTEAVATERKQKISATLTIRQTKENVTRLKELGLITEEEEQKMREVIVNAITKYVGGKL